MAVRDTLLTDDEYHNRDFGSRIFNAAGFVNGGTPDPLIRSRITGIGCMDAQDAAYGARQILERKLRPKAEEQELREHSRDGWLEEARKAATTFVTGLRDADKSIL